MSQEGIRFATPLIKKLWYNLETLETAINYLDVMLTMVSQSSLGSKGEEKNLQVHMRGNEILMVTVNSKTGGNIGFTEHVAGVDPILLHMLLTTVRTYMPGDFHPFIRDAFGIDLVKELNIEGLVEEEKGYSTPTQKPVTQLKEDSLLTRTLVLSHVHGILRGITYLEDVPTSLRPLVLDELASNNSLSPQEWGDELNKLVRSPSVPGYTLTDLVAKELNKRGKNDGRHN